MTHSTTPAAPMSGRAVPALQQEVAAARGELARVDAKCALLVSLAAGGLALTFAAPALPASAGAASFLREVAGFLFAAAMGALLVAVLPRIPRRGGTGFVAHARRACPADLLTSLTPGADGAKEEADRLSAEVWRLSRLTLAKYQTIAAAVWLLIAATAAVALALPLS
ncbi:Pycsar system effector family protein [Streptosporangium saharense]|uniref:Pycsar effector protein domain-containing protein n=1 Tax=Streptosporangium saharense TaxID=1706840 RepID=A0A7W7QH79_9ACTN|nr:Pycsar system effector family protein [Streptosporangium saharense]MBB4913339.1 hypothetical protein [Streptosporangium saharense]